MTDGFQKIDYRRLVITDCSAGNLDFQLLYGIFRQTLKPDMTFRQFRAYYCSARLEYIDATLLVSGREVIGFCAAAFYTCNIDGKKYTVGRAATGILPAYRGDTLPKWALYKKYMFYWSRHPLRRIILSAYVANPLIYAMICKYTGIAYPRPGSRPPAHIVKVKNELLRSQNLHEKEGPDFVVEIHFSVKIGRREQERIFGSKDRHVQYFLGINPEFRQQRGVVVVIPVNLGNIFLSSLRFFYYFHVKIVRWIYVISRAVPKQQ